MVSDILIFKEAISNYTPVSPSSASEYAENGNDEKIQFFFMPENTII
jgi:hypothetical protein